MPGSLNHIVDDDGFMRQKTMKKWIKVSLLVICITLVGCAFKSKYGTFTVTMTPAEIAELYNRMMERSTSQIILETEEGVIVKIEEK